jgi:hypothetical protein
MTERAEKGKNQIEIKTSDPVLAVLSGVCSEGGEVIDSELEFKLAEICKMRPSKVGDVLENLAKNDRLASVDMKSDPQTLVIKTLGFQAVEANLDRLDCLETENLLQFPWIDFNLLDHLFEVVGEAEWVEHDGEGAISYLSREINAPKASISNRVFRLLKDGFIEVGRNDPEHKKKTTDIRVLANARGYYNMLKAHPKAVELIGDGLSDKPYPLEGLSEAELRVALEDVQDEIKLLRQSSDEEPPLDLPVNAGNMDRADLLEATQCLQGYMEKLISLREEDGEEDLIEGTT